MNPLRELLREHAAIRALTARFEFEATLGETQGAIDGEAVGRLLHFFEHELDGHHQEKEERILLPRLVAHARGRELDLVLHLGQDHARQRAVLAHLANQLESASWGEPNSLRVLAREARRFVRLQQQHSRWEQHEIFSLARRWLTPDDERAIASDFRRLDEARGGSVWDAACALAAWLDQRRAFVPAMPV
ncbi:MAG: hypothetical protein EXS08_13775 [Planctomycetes bacterium]|nr:hypothetical protein [Planctomycetota bacterium]